MARELGLNYVELKFVLAGIPSIHSFKEGAEFPWATTTSVWHCGHIRLYFP